MKYEINGKRYDVNSVEFDGEIINILNTSITDLSYSGGKGYSVFDCGDEVFFETFDEAYNFVLEQNGRK